jgi:hypothetical protein
MTFAMIAIVLLKTIESYDLMSSYKQGKARNLVRLTALASQFMVIAVLSVEILHTFDSFQFLCAIVAVHTFTSGGTSQVVQIK